MLLPTHKSTAINVEHGTLLKSTSKYVHTFKVYYKICEYLQ